MNGGYVLIDLSEYVVNGSTSLYIYRNDNKYEYDRIKAALDANKPAYIKINVNYTTYEGFAITRGPTNVFIYKTSSEEIRFTITAQNDYIQIYVKITDL